MQLLKCLELGKRGSLTQVLVLKKIILFWSYRERAARWGCSVTMQRRSCKSQEQISLMIYQVETLTAKAVIQMQSVRYSKHVKGVF